jgi:pSer/pThr/pTyr-binding forkhead associated (FHA) protein
MGTEAKGQLTPVGGGDSIPLIRDQLTIGRRESCDICLRFPNISGVHCELTFRDGYWFVRDFNSTNGVKVNGVRVQERVLLPGDKISIAKRQYTIDYTLSENRKPLEEVIENDILSQSLLERAGLLGRRRDAMDTPPPRPNRSLGGWGWDEDQ